jgi:hypothetical protein
MRTGTAPSGEFVLARKEKAAGELRLLVIGSLANGLSLRVARA